jgi:hypothetical protein
VLLPPTLALHRLMISESVRFPELARTIWRSGHEQATNILIEWIMRQQEAGVLRQGQSPRVLASQFVELAVGDALLCAQIGIPAPVNRDDALNAAIETFLCGQATSTGPWDARGERK